MKAMLEKIAQEQELLKEQQKMIDAVKTALQKCDPNFESSCIASKEAVIKLKEYANGLGLDVIQGPASDETIFRYRFK